MKLNTFIKELPALCNERKIALQVALVIILILGIVVGGRYLQKAYLDAEENKQQMQNMTIVINKYNKLAQEINAEEFKPVKTDQLDSVQTDLLSKIQQNNLTLSSLDSKTDKKATNYQIYKLSIKGSWQNVVSFLEDFGTKDALITISNFSIKSGKEVVVKEKDVTNNIDLNSIECDITYNVYTIK